MNITAAVAHAAHTPLSFQEVQLAEPREHELVVEVRAAGLCHTDVAARDGVYGLPYPLVLGHEGAGVVMAVGSAVTGLAPGDYVVLSFSSCGECPSCTAGRPAYCLQFTEENYIGSRPDGSATLASGAETVHGHFFGQSSFATHALVNDRNAVRVDNDLDLSVLAPLGCGIQTGAGAIMRSLAARPDSSLLVLGAGPVGLAAVMGAVLQGCATIIVVEPVADRRALAVELGATNTVDPLADRLEDAVRAIAPSGVDYVFDTTGRPDVLQAAIAVCAVGANVGLVGVPSDFSVELPLNIVSTMQRGLTVRGIVEGDSDPQTFIPELIAHYRAGRFPLERLVATFPFSEINEAIEAQHRGDAVKVVVVSDAR